MCSEPLVMNLDIRVLGFMSTKVKHFFTSRLIVTLVVDKTRTITDWLQTIEAWSFKHQVAKQESKRLVDDIFSILRIKNNVQPLIESKQKLAARIQPVFQEALVLESCLQYIQKHVNADGILNW